MKPAMSVLGIDMAKRVLHVVGMDERGKIVWRKRLSRHDLIPEKRTDERPVTPTGVPVLGGRYARITPYGSS